MKPVYFPDGEVLFGRRSAISRVGFLVPSAATHMKKICFAEPNRWFQPEKSLRSNDFPASVQFPLYNLLPRWFAALNRTSSTSPSGLQLTTLLTHLHPQHRLQTCLTHSSLPPSPPLLFHVPRTSRNLLDVLPLRPNPFPRQPIMQQNPDRNLNQPKTRTQSCTKFDGKRTCC